MSAKRDYSTTGVDPKKKKKKKSKVTAIVAFCSLFLPQNICGLSRGSFLCVGNSNRPQEKPPSHFFFFLVFSNPVCSRNTLYIRESLLTGIFSLRELYSLTAQESVQPKNVQQRLPTVCLGSIIYDTVGVCCIDAQALHAGRVEAAFRMAVEGEGDEVGRVGGGGGGEDDARRLTVEDRADLWEWFEEFVEDLSMDIAKVTFLFFCFVFAVSCVLACSTACTLH